MQLLDKAQKLLQENPRDFKSTSPRQRSPKRAAKRRSQSESKVFVSLSSTLWAGRSQSREELLAPRLSFSTAELLESSRRRRASALHESQQRHIIAVERERTSSKGSSVGVDNTVFSPRNSQGRQRAKSDANLGVDNMVFSPRNSQGRQRAKSDSNLIGVTRFMSGALLPMDTVQESQWMSAVPTCTRSPGNVDGGLSQSPQNSAAAAVATHKHGGRRLIKSLSEGVSLVRDEAFHGSGSTPMRQVNWSSAGAEPFWRLRQRAQSDTMPRTNLNECRSSNQSDDASRSQSADSPVSHRKKFGERKDVSDNPSEPGGCRGRSNEMPRTAQSDHTTRMNIVRLASWQRFDDTSPGASVSERVHDGSSPRSDDVANRFHMGSTATASPSMAVARSDVRDVDNDRTIDACGSMSQLSSGGDGSTFGAAVAAANAAVAAATVAAASAVAASGVVTAATSAASASVKAGAPVDARAVASAAAAAADAARGAGLRGSNDGRADANNVSEGDKSRSKRGAAPQRNTTWAAQHRLVISANAWQHGLDTSARMPKSAASRSSIDASGSRTRRGRSPPEVARESVQNTITLPPAPNSPRTKRSPKTGGLSSRIVRGVRGHGLT